MAKITLFKPVTIDGTEVTEIELRDVTVSDYVALGPVMIATVDPKTMKTSVVEDQKTMLNYIVRLSGLTDKEVKSLHLKDFMRIATEVKKSLDFTDDTD